MRNVSQSKKTIIFLGAGASKADGAPLQSELIKEYCSRNLSRRKSAKKSIQHIWDDEIYMFLDDFFGINIDEPIADGKSVPTFEEILGILEIADTQQESFRNYGTSHIVESGTKPRVPHIHDLLILMIAEVLDKKLRRGWRNHGELVEQLKSCGWLNETSFISLNYDILIDNALIEIHDEWDLDYHVNFINFERGDWHAPDPDNSILLLKLHGSLNWLYCPTCRTLQLTPKVKGVCKLKWNPKECVCRKCDTLSIPIIIPPKYFKVLSNIYLRQVWDRAERELLLADRIIFCGYSFPDADIHIKYLLKRAEINRHNGDMPHIYILNRPNEEPREGWDNESERLRYRRFFSHKDRIHWTNLSFQEFAENPELIEDFTDVSA